MVKGFIYQVSVEFYILQNNHIVLIALRIVLWFYCKPKHQIISCSSDNRYYAIKSYFNSQSVLSLSSGAGRDPRVVLSTAAFHARVRGSVPGLGGLKETKMFLPHPHVKLSIVGSLRDREVWRTVSSYSSHHPQEVLLAQFSLKPDSFHFKWCGH